MNRLAFSEQLIMRLCDDDELPYKVIVDIEHSREATEISLGHGELDVLRGRSASILWTYRQFHPLMFGQLCLQILYCARLIPYYIAQLTS